MGSVTSVVALNPDGMIASASADITIRIWDARKGATTAQLTSSITSGGGQTTKINALAVLHGQKMASGASQPEILLWDTSLTPPVQITSWTAHGIAASVFTLHASLDGKALISGASDNLVKVRCGFRLEVIL